MAAPIRRLQPVSRPRLWEEQTSDSRMVMPMSPRSQHNKTVDGYRRLAEKCREEARTTSWDNERGRLLEMAAVWNVIADRFERASHNVESASTHGHAAVPEPVK